MIVAMKPANKARGTVWRSWWSEASHPRGNRKIQHTPDAEPDFVCHMDGPVTAMGWLADPLTSCAAARPEGGAGCLNGHVRICAGIPGKPGAYRDYQAQNWERVSQGMDWLRQFVKRNPQERLMTLLHHVNVDSLRAAFYALKRDAAAGADGVTWQEYADGLENRLVDLCERVRRGAYRAPPPGG